MMTETLKNQKALIDAGFSETDIASWQVQQRQALSDAGYNQAQIDTEFGEPPLDPKPAAKAVRDNIEKAIALVDEFCDLDKTSKISWKR